MKERPIIFSSEMVRATLEGRKMQTRRVIKPQPAIKPRVFKNEDGVFYSLMDKCVYQKSPFGTIGDRLWVRETWFEWVKNNSEQLPYLYKATIPSDDLEILRQSGHAFKWKPSLFMPRWASRISLEIINIRVERVQEITERDARDEGVEHPNIAVSPPSTYSDYKHKFKLLWDSINAKHGCGWDINPWVWAIEFKKL